MSCPYCNDLEPYWGLWHKGVSAFFVDGDGRMIHYPSKALAEHARLSTCDPKHGGHKLGDIEVREFTEDKQ